MKKTKLWQRNKSLLKDIKIMMTMQEKDKVMTEDTKKKPKLKESYKETDIKIFLGIDGQGKCEIDRDCLIMLTATSGSLDIFSIQRLSGCGLPSHCRSRYNSGNCIFQSYGR